MQKQCKNEGCANESYRAYAICNPCRLSSRRYGINVPERNALLESQNNQCKLCNRPIEFDGTASQYSACIDHNHETGEVRGILCGNCNTNIGYLENSKIDINRLNEYLK